MLIQASVTIQQFVNETREIESWMISKTEAENLVSEAQRNVLIGAHINVQDYFDARPFFIIPMPSRRKRGKIFSDVFLLDAAHLPEDTPYFLVNDVFLRECLPKTKAEHSLHIIDAFSVLFEKGAENLLKLQNEGCMFIGVCGESRTHLTRGCD